MLSANAGVVADAVLADFDSGADANEQDSGDPAIGVPLLCGTSLLVCPVAPWSFGDSVWSEGDSAEIAPTSGEGTTDGSGLIAISTGELVGCWLPEDLCTLPPPTFSLSGDDESGDSGDPTDAEPSVVDPVIDPGSADGSDSGVDPVVIVDPPVDPLPPFEPIDIRVQFVSSGEDWACYYYSIGPDGAVTNVSVFATFNEPTIAAFVADHADDGSVSIEETEWGWSISGFPVDLAPPVPETGVFAVPDTGLPTDETAVDPILMACDGGFLPRESSEIDPVEAVDPEARSLATASVVETPAAVETPPAVETPAAVESPSTASAPTSGDMPFNVMAAFAANASATSGDTTVPLGSVRRRR